MKKADVRALFGHNCIVLYLYNYRASQTIWLVLCYGTMPLPRNIFPFTKVLIVHQSVLVGVVYAISALSQSIQPLLNLRIL